MDHTLKILDFDKTVRVQKGDLLADKISESGIDLSLYCQKKSLCGKCFVEIVDGDLPDVDKAEEFFIQKNKLSQSHRLACSYKITGDLTIKIPAGSLLQKTFILKTGLKLPLHIDPLVKKYYGKLDKPGLEHPDSLLSEWKAHFRKKNLIISLDLLRSLPGILKNSGHNVTTVLYDGNEIMEVEPGDTTHENYGLAVDLGTTTLVVELIDLNTGESVGDETGNNGQMKYGMDVVSRIGFTFQSAEHLKKLQAAVRETLSRMIEQVLDRSRISHEHIYEIVFAGNTTMSHLLLGIPVDTLAVSPFHAVFHKLPAFAASEIGLRLNRNAKAFIVPNIKSFVGGDITAGLQATDLTNRKGNHLLVDLGTNGEIVLKTEKKFVATSTAAGPAFEGMNIGCGMLAMPGAIYKAEKKHHLDLYTIGKGEPRGICGTGLIDLIACYLDEGKITPSGKIAGNRGTIEVAENIAISQQDIREIQLAAAAVKTGIRMICERFRIKKESLDNVFIAGAFGNYLNKKNAIRIGLLPDIDPEKIVYVGNSSLAGARALLLSGPARKGTESLIHKIRYISLASDPKFQKYFIDSLNFGEGKDSR